MHSYPIWYIFAEWWEEEKKRKRYLYTLGQNVNDKAIIWPKFEKKKQFWDNMSLSVKEIQYLYNKKGFGIWRVYSSRQGTSIR